MRFFFIFMLLWNFLVWKPLMLLLKLIIYVIGHLTKLIFGKAIDFSKNKKHEEVSWNTEALGFTLFFLVYSVFALSFIRQQYLMIDYSGLQAVWVMFFEIVFLFVSIPALVLPFKKSAFIEEMPLLRYERFKITRKEEGREKVVFNLSDYTNVFGTVIPYLSSFFAFSSLGMFFLYPLFPRITLGMVGLSFIGILVFYAVRLTGLSQSELYDMVANGEKYENENEGKEEDDELSYIEDLELRELVRGQKNKEKADIDIIQTAPSKSQPKSNLITIPEGSRLQHFQLLGPTGVGKSVLLLNMITQDLTNPNVGVCVIEPFADLAYKSAVISKKINRTYYYINPEYEHTHSFNPLDGEDYDKIAEANAEAFAAGLDKATPGFYRDVQSKALVMAIRCLKWTRGDKTTYFDVYDLLRPSSGGFRKKVIHQLEEQGQEALRIQLQDYHNTFANDKTAAKGEQYYEGLFTYLFKITQNKKMAKVICQKSTFSIHEAFNKGEVILLSTGFHVLGRDLSSTLGRLITVLLKDEAFKRQSVEENERAKLPLIALYIDEFQNYIFESVKDVQTMARKTRFSMCIAHQDLAQLREYNPDFAKIIYNNARQKIVYGGIDYDDCVFIAEQAGEEYKKIKDKGVDMWNPFDIRHNLKEEKREVITGAGIYNLPAFNPVKGTAGKVFCKFVINNEQEIFDDGEGGLQNFFIGLVQPMFPMEFFKMKDNFVLNEETLETLTERKKPIHSENIDRKKEKVPNNIIEGKETLNHDEIHEEDGEIMELVLNEGEKGNNDSKKDKEETDKNQLLDYNKGKAVSSSSLEDKNQTELTEEVGEPESSAVNTIDDEFLGNELDDIEKLLFDELEEDEPKETVQDIGVALEEEQGEDDSDSLLEELIKSS